MNISSFYNKDFNNLKKCILIEPSFKQYAISCKKKIVHVLTFQCQWCKLTGGEYLFLI